MAIFNGHVITNAGRNLIGRAMAGEGRVIITRAAMGDGKPSQDIRELTQLISEKITANVADVFNDRGTINLKVQITNSQLEEAFKTEEFGIFAKIEGDEEEILYSYCNAVEADTIPSNSLGDIFVEEHTVYIAFSSNTEVDIYIKEGVVFLTMETANKNYVQTGLVVEGKLSNGRTSLKENGQYQADNGKWYHNIGGNRSWESGKGEADEELIEISYFNLYSEIIKKQNETDSRLLTRAKKIWEAINELFNDKQNKTDSSLLTTVKTVVGAINELFNNKLEKGGYSGNAKNLNDEIVKKASTSQLGRMMVGTGLTADSSGRVSIEETSSRRPVSDAEKATWNGKLNQGTVPNSLNSAEKIVAALQGNGGLKFDPNVLHIGDAGTKRVGYYYLDKLKDGIFECLEETTTTVNDSSKFRDISNKASAERLDNLQEYIIISFRDDGTYNVVKNTFNKDIIIDGNGVITLPKSQLSSIWARGKIGNKSYGFGIYENGLSSPENLIAFESKKMEDISVLTCLYSGNKIRVSNIIMSSGSASDRMNMSYTEGYSANSLKYPTVLTISTISKS